MRVIVLAIVLAVVWLVWSGIYQNLILAFGAGSVLLVTWICWLYRTPDFEGAPFHLIPKLFVYVPWLLWEMVKANLDVTRRILSPRMPISPVLFEVPSTQTTELGRAIFANSITLTPGTVSHAVEDGVASVHAIATDVRDGLLDGPMDRKVTWVEGEGGA